MRKELDKIYDPARVEDRLYQGWMKAGYFHADVHSQKKPYTIVIPPPNITGQLHMGHALDETLQDILIRFRKMQGYEALWVPGTDHASIATEAKIVAAMKEEGISKEDLGREGFLERAWAWKEQYGGRIVEQLKKLGSACDWERERFTLDEGCSRAVREVFCRLYEKGLIYRGERIINWCPTCRTSISDAEVEYAEQAGHFWHLRYPIVGTGEFLELATTRPETMLGDTAVAVHPDDERYRHLVGKKVLLPLVEKEIPIIADEYVEMDFGTGVVKITPAHDPNDFEVGLRHNLPVISVLDEGGVVNENGGRYAGMDRYEARAAIVRDLEAGGYLSKVEDIQHNVGSCYRCSTTIEPAVSKQWFVKMKPLAEPAIEAVRTHQTRFVPERFEKIYFNWMENIRDWCISRQLWWGHRIPAWYCEECGEMTVAREDPAACPHCGSHKLHQDKDTLDTWFSSALWPFSTLGWPEQTADLQKFYPTNTLVTGYDIIFFWVARMIFSAIEQTGQVPFDTVLIHGLVRDAQGRKMSKSLGNGIDPLEIIEKYGADALRFTLATGNSPGNDLRFSEERVTASRNFANKLWNAGRFVLMNLEEELGEQLGLPTELAIEDRWLLSQYNALVRDVTANLERFELGLAVQKLYDFIWDVYCDWYIEIVKSRLQAGGETSRDAQRVLCSVLSGTLQLLHPFMPFITEEIWLALPHEEASILLSHWPQWREELDFSADEQEFGRIMALIQAVRARRAEMNVPPSKKAKVYIATEYAETFSACAEIIRRLTWASEVEIGPAFSLEGAVQVVIDGARAFIPMEELIDKQKELARLEKEKASCERELSIIDGKLGNPGFVAKAPAALVEQERVKRQRAEERLAKIAESIAALQ